LAFELTVVILAETTTEEAEDITGYKAYRVMEL
jgi:hypothetical protein